MDELLVQQVKLRRILTAGDLLIYLFATFVVSILLTDISAITFRLVIESFLPFALSWMVLAPFAGLFRAPIALDFRRLWQVALLVLLSTPLGAWAGNAWVGTTFTAPFIIGMTVVATVMIVAWRYMLIRLGARHAV